MTCLESAIRGLGGSLRQFIDGAEESADEAESSVEVAQATVEVLLGCMFVVAQTHFGHVLRRTRAVHHAAERKDKKKLSAGSGVSLYDKRGLLSIGERASGVCIAELVNAAANYFKHRDEWRRTNPAKPQVDTCVVLLGGSIDPTGSVVLLEVAEFLNWSLELVDCCLLEFLRRWESEVLREVEADLRARGMTP
jgi:hypothetical protein